MKTMLLALMLASGMAAAHEGQLPAPKHNGVVAESSAGSTAELSLDGGMLMVYLSDHDGKALDSKGAQGEVTLLAGNEKQVLPLKASGANSLMAAGKYTTAAGSKALIKVTLPGKTPELFKFTLK